MLSQIMDAIRFPRSACGKSLLISVLLSALLNVSSATLLLDQVSLARYQNTTSTSISGHVVALGLAKANFEPLDSIPSYPLTSTATSVQAVTKAPTTPAPKHLSKRLCWEQNNQWLCDEDLPTDIEMVLRLTIPRLGGGIDPRKRGIFYTNLGDFPTAIAMANGWMTSKGYPSVNVLTSRSGAWFSTQYRKVEQIGARQSRAILANYFVYCFDQLFAGSLTARDAYVFTKKGEDWAADSIWAAIEYPTLTLNPNVDRIWRVDPRAPADGGEPCEPELLWERGRDAVIDQDPGSSLFCPDEFLPDVPAYPLITPDPWKNPPIFPTSTSSTSTSTTMDETVVLSTPVFPTGKKREQGTTLVTKRKAENSVWDG